MKKILFCIAVLGTVLSCSGEKPKSEKTANENQEQVEAIDKSTKKLDESIKSMETELEKTQGEIDSLLNNI